MKKIKITLTCILSVFCYLLAQSQQHSALSEKTQSSEIIVEGKLIHQESFWNEDRTRILTKNTIQVFSTLKGNTSTTLKIVTHGGIIDDVFQIIPHVKKLELGEKGIFFCKQFKLKGITSPVQMLNGSEGFLKYIETENGRLIVDIHGNKVSQRQLQDSILESVFNLSANFNSPESPNNLESIEFDFANIEFTQNASFLEFDILAKASNSDLKFAGGEIAIKYDVQPFGISVVNNEKVESFKKEIIESPIYTLSMEDVGLDTLKLIIEARCEDNEEMYTLSSLLKKLSRVKLEISDFTTLGQLSLEDFLMDGNVFYYDESKDDCFPFDEIFLPNPISPQLTPMIDTFFPNSITVGTGDILTIKGSMFGATKGEIVFPNANDDGLTKARANSADIVWTDTLITVRMPSSPRPAGSGFFELTTSANLTTTANAWLDVKYGVLNVRRNNDSTAHRLHLSAGSTDEILFFYEDTIATIQNTQPIIDIIELALKKWQCETGVKWKLSGQSNFHTASPNDGTNLIYFADTTEFTGNLSDLSAYNVLNGYALQCNGQIRFYIRDMDIVIKETEPWVYDPTYNDSNINPSLADFHSVILHELGHSHKLTHVRELDKVMYHKVNLGQTRRILHPFDIEGGVNVIDSSQNLMGCLAPNGVQSILPIGEEFPADCTTPVNDISFLEHLTVFPTIFDNYINLEFQTNKSVNLKIKLFDVLGRNVLKEEYQSLPSGINQLEINTDGVSSNGIYFLKLEIGNKITTRKVFKINH